MLSDILPVGLVTPVMLSNIKRMAQFIALFYGPYFLQARLPTAAPRLDLELWNHMTTYQVCHKNINLVSQSVIVIHLRQGLFIQHTHKHT